MKTKDFRHGPRYAHQRWDIENYGFNETTQGWHADHVYRHNSNAMVGFLLTLFLAYNLFYAFVLRNLKPELRQAHTYTFWARLVEAALLAPRPRSVCSLPDSQGLVCLDLKKPTLGSR